MALDGYENDAKQFYKDAGFTISGVCKGAGINRLSLARVPCHRALISTARKTLEYMEAENQKRYLRSVEEAYEQYHKSDQVLERCRKEYGIEKSQFQLQKVDCIFNDVLFRDDMHKDFFLTYLPRCRYTDVYHTALIYCLGIARDTRNHVDQIYDFKTGEVKTECLHEDWITSGSARVVRMAYNLYNNGTPSVYDYEDAEEQLEECERYTVGDLFCCEYAKYFWQAIKIRYPEYC